MNDYHITPHGSNLRVTWDVDLGQLVTDLARDAAVSRKNLERSASGIVRELLELAAALETDGELGFVKFFDTDRGWGFIVDREGHDVFVHYRGITGIPGAYRSLEQGQAVRFKRRMGKTTMEAIDVVPEEPCDGQREERGV